MKPEIIDVPPVISDGDHGTAPRLAFELLESKFHPPVARPGIVARAALVNRLAAAQAPVITIVAPPGYGKTTLLAQWAERVWPRVAWVSCDDGDNDPVVLLSALAVALDRIEPIDPAVFWALASSGAGITVVPKFVSAITSMRLPVTLVLDHVEAVTNKRCLNTIAELALHLPLGWQFALASRTKVPLPTARLRVQGGIVEVGADDLAMSPEEASSLLEGAGVKPDVASTSELVQRTEGWPTGLYIAALAIRPAHGKARSASLLPAMTVTWVITCALNSLTASRTVRCRSSPAPRSSTGCADRSATRSWVARPQGGSSRRWRAGISWWSRWTVAASGTGITTCSENCCRRNSGDESPTWSGIFTPGRPNGTRRTPCRRPRSSMPKRLATTTESPAWSWNWPSPSGQAGASRPAACASSV